MKKVIVESRSAKLIAPQPTVNGGRRNKSTSNDVPNAAISLKVDKANCSIWDNSDYIYRNRKNPLNGKNCFFSEASFKHITGPGPSFEEKIMTLIAHINSEKQNVDSKKSRTEQSEKKDSSLKVQLNKDKTTTNRHETLQSLDVSLNQDIDTKSKVMNTINNSDNNKQIIRVNSKSVLQTTTFSESKNGSELTPQSFNHVEENNSVLLNTSQNNACTSKDIVKKTVSLNEPKTKKIGSESTLQIVKGTEIVQQYSLHNETIEVSTGSSGSSQNLKVPEGKSIALTTDTTTNYASAVLQNLSICTKQKLEKLEQGNSNVVVEISQDADIDQHISHSPAPIVVSKDLDFNDRKMENVNKNMKMIKNQVSGICNLDITHETKSNDISKTGIDEIHEAQPVKTHKTGLGGIHESSLKGILEQDLHEIHEPGIKQLCDIRDTHTFSIDNIHEQGLGGTHELGLNETHELGLNETHELGLNETRELGLNETHELGLNETHELGLNQSHIPTTDKFCSETHNSSSYRYLNIPQSGCKENDIMQKVHQVKEANDKLEVSLKDACSSKEVGDTNCSALSPQPNNELCLIMPSLTSDDDNDEDIQDITAAHRFENNSRHNESRQDIDAVAGSMENQLLPTMPEGITNINSDSHQANSQDIESSCTGVSTLLTANNYFNSTFNVSIGMSNQNISLFSDEMEIQKNQMFQQSNQGNTSNMDHSYNSNMLHTPAQSDNDIPIFSVKETSPKSNFKSISSIDQHKEIDTLNIKLGNLHASEDKLAAENVNRTEYFKKSDLKKEEHALYLKLYKKYVHFFTHLGAPPIMTVKQRTEINTFQKLHTRVLDEQQQFQNYLRVNAMKNPNSFVYMKKVAKSYATCRARSYRLSFKHAAQFSPISQSQILFHQNGDSVDLRFQQPLLEVGLPPRIKLPDVNIRQKPVPLQYDILKIDTCFPRYSKKSVQGYIHHEPVSQDINVNLLATKYDFDVVMSSSVVKCLFDNHGPSYDRAWNIPIHVVEIEANSKPKKVIYLDKPLFDNDLHIRDYNTLFHKYALRTFVSHPRRKNTAEIFRNLFNQPTHKEKSVALDDTFEMFSSNAESLETFGSFKSLDQNKEPSQAGTVNVDSKVNNRTNSGKSSLSANSGRAMRFNKKAYKDFDEVSTFDQYSDNMILDNQISENTNIDSFLPAKRKRAESKSTSLKQPTGSSVNETMSVVDSEYEVEVKRKRIQREYSVKNEECQTPSKDIIIKSAKHNKDLVEHKVPVPVPDIGSPSQLELLSKTGSPSYKKKSLSSHSIDNQLSKIVPDTPLSPVMDTLMSPVMDTPMSPVMDTPMSPTMDTPLSPSMETPMSPIKESHISTMKEIPLSPVKVIPLSPLKKIITSTNATKLLRSYTRHVDLQNKSLNSSPSQQSPSLSPKSSKKELDQPSFSGSMMQPQLFTPLDSILGPCFSQTDKNEQQTTKEDPTNYQPPTEVHSSIVYNLWSLNSVNVLIRSRCQGVLKDPKKARRIYFSPKMEHQTAYGVEQVTTSEMIKDWISCYVRPNTNLLRARINAFTSEIMMFEELETNQILRSPLNFKPEDRFKFLDRVFQQLLSLNCGKYLLTHDIGDNFCGIRDGKSSPRDVSVPKKKTSKENSFRWIPIDPTILLPFHLSYNRIPATFIPKDVNYNHSGGAKKDNFNNNNGINNKFGGATNGHWKKKKKKKNKKFKNV